MKLHSLRRILMVTLSSFLAILMLVQGMPISVFAEGPEEETTVLDQEDSDDGIEDDLLPEDPADEEIDSMEEPQDAGEPDLPLPFDTPQVLFESDEKRTATSKTFHRTDGMDLMAVYPEPVHFADANGALVDYDNRLTETQTEYGTYFSPKANDTEILLSSTTANESLVRLSKDGHFLSWTYDGVAEQAGKVAEREEDDDPTTLENLCAELDFVDVYPEVDLQYLLIGGKLKENLVLKDAEAPASFVIRYSSSDLTPELSEGAKTIFWKNAEGETVFEICAPYAEDANGETSTDLVFTLMGTQEEVTTVVLQLDEAWLKEDGRAFPVMVDPVIVTTQFWDSTSLKSAFVSEAYPTNCYGRNSVTNTYVGSLYVGDAASFGKSRGYIYIPLPTLQKGDVVVKATLYTFLRSPSANLQISLHEANGSWQENTITWNNAPAFSSEIADFNNIIVTNSFMFFDWDITKLVDKWYKNSSANNGVVLISDAEDWNNDTYAWFYANGYYNNGYLYDPVVRPVACLELRNVSGYENYYTYVGTAVGRGGYAQVNTFTGNLVVTQPLTVDNGGELLPVSISAVYNSGASFPELGRVGKGWKMSYQLYIRPNPYLKSTSTDEERKYRYYYYDADGTRHFFYFADNNSNIGIDEDGLGLTLEVTSTGYVLTDQNENRMVFNSLGNITAIQDTNGKQIGYTYGTALISGTYYQRIESISDGAGRLYSIVYNQTYPLFIDKIIDPAGRITKFTHGSNRLYKITFPDQKELSFAYTSNDLLLQGITAPDGVQTNIAYDSSPASRTTQLETVGGTLTGERYGFSYLPYETTVSNLTGQTFKYQYNSFGQTTGILDFNGQQAAAYSYEVGSTPIRGANRILSASSIQQSIQNSVVNPGFQGSYSGYIVYKKVATDNASIVYDASYGHTSPGSVKVHRASTDSGSILLVQQLNLPAGDYTISAFVSTNGASFAVSAPVLQAEIWTTAGSHLYNRISEPISGTQTGEWIRQTLTVTLEEGQCLKLTPGFYEGYYGDVYLDDIQVEPGYGTAPYNLLQNPSFGSGVSVWTGTTYSVSSTDQPTGFPAAAAFSSSITGTSQISQTVAFAGSAGDSFSAGAWLKATSLPLDEPKSNDGLYSEFALKIELLSGSMVKKTVYAQANPFVSGWQFVTAGITAITPFQSIRVSIVYEYNTGTIRTTGVYCVHKRHGSVYDYDDEGNLLSVTDGTGISDSYGYTGTDLSSVVSPDGSASFGFYDGSHRLTDVLTTQSRRYSYSYDANGNLTSARADAQPFSASVSTNKTYYIINAGTGLALGLQNDAKVREVSFSATDPKLRWTVKSGSVTGEYTLYNASAGGYLRVTAESSGYSTFSVVSGSPVTASYLTIVPTGNGSFAIKTKASSFAACLDAHIFNYETVAAGDLIRQYNWFQKLSQCWFFYACDVDALYMSTAATYTANGNLPASSTNAAGKTTAYTYAAPANGRVTSVTDPRGYTTSYTYDTMGHTTQAASSGETVSFQYTDDLLTQVTAPGGGAYTFTYDALGRVTQTQIDGDQLSHTNYDAYGRISSDKYVGDAHHTYYTYDSLDRLTQTTYNGGTKRYYYDTNGRLAQFTDTGSNTRTLCVYDVFGRLTEIREYTGTGFSQNTLKNGLYYTYDAATGRVTDIRTKSALGENTVSVTYGSASSGQIPSYVYQQSLNGSPIRGYTYDKLGRLEQVKTYTSGNKTITTDYTYEDLGNGRTSGRVVGYDVNSYHMAYAYDANGNVTSYDDGIYVTTYTYDVLNRLTRENNQKAGKTYVYTYNNGNLTSRKTYAYTTGTLGAVQATETYTYGKTNFHDRVTAFNGKAITYTAETGVMTGYGDYALTWFKIGLLGSYSKTGDTHTFTYDMDGRRLSRTDNGVTTTFVYAGDQLVGQTWGGNTLAFICNAAGEYVGFTYNGTNYYYVKNLQGDVVQIVNAAKTTVVKYYYDAWGYNFATEGSLASTVGAVNPIRYRGYYYDSGTGLYYLHSRYYNPELRRFISPDKLLDTQSLDGYNLFAYCGNNPVNGYDPDGYYVADAVKQWNLSYMGPISFSEYQFYHTLDSVIEGCSNWMESVWAGVASLFTDSYTTLSVVESNIDFALVPDTPPILTPPPIQGSSNPAPSQKNVCFIAGTQVLTNAGKVSIETIHIGDQVYATDPETGETALKRIVRTFENETNHLVHITVNSETISCTNEHPFYHAIKGWTAACELKAGDILVAVNGEYVVVEQVQHEILEEPVKVYNFEVEDFHTYYVGTVGILVHNSCNHNNEWAKERRLFWKATSFMVEEDQDFGIYIANGKNIDRMRVGLAPIGKDGHSIELHHWNGIANVFYDYSPVSWTEHRYIHYGIPMD